MVLGMQGSNGFLCLPHAHDLLFCTNNIEAEYAIEKEPIARGKFAVVRKAYHRTTGKSYAAKYVKRRRRQNAEEEARHEIAVLLLGRSERHIVRLHQVYETRSDYIILLEFAEGGDLQNYLDEAVILPEDTVRSLLHQILLGLRFLHKRNIAHLDLKPQNVVMMWRSPEAGVKLVDFGLSRLITKDIDVIQIKGTPDYIAPEVVNYEVVSQATDMWAVGVLAYVLLTGCTPFGGDTDQETFVNITQAEFDFPDELFSDTSDLAKDFIRSLLVKRPSKRMSVEECLQHSWITLGRSYPLFKNNIISNYHKLYPVAETECGDSAYSSDTNGSPTYVDNSPSYTSQNGPSSYHCSPVVSDLQQNNFHENQFRAVAAALSNRKFKKNGLSENMENSLRAVSRQQTLHRALRAASLVIDDPRYLIDDKLTRDSDVDSGVSCHDYEESPQGQFQLYSSGYYDTGDTSNMVSWDEFSDLRTKKGMFSPIARPWEKLCNGSVSRAISQFHQLSNKGAPLGKLKNNKNNFIRQMSMIDLYSSALQCDDRYGWENNFAKTSSESNFNYDTSGTIPIVNIDSNSCNGEILQNGGILNKNSQSRLIKQKPKDLKNDLRVSLKGSKPAQEKMLKEESRTKQNLLSGKSGTKGLKGDCKKDPFSSSGLCKKPSNPDLKRTKEDISYCRKMNKQRSLGNLSLTMSMSRLNLIPKPLTEMPEEEEEERLPIVNREHTLPRRKCERPALTPFLRGNSLHMSFRTPKMKEPHI